MAISCVGHRNFHGILAIQQESVNAIQHAASLVLPGVDLVLFGPKVLAFSLEAQPDALFADCEAYYEHVHRILADAPVKVSRQGNPWSRI